MMICYISCIRFKSEVYMSKIAIVTDSNSGITQKRAKELGVYVVPMPLYINDVPYYEDITLTQEEFYKKLTSDPDVSTSMPTPVSIMELWEQLLINYDAVVHIPMASGLSGTCELATGLAMEYEGKVEVVDNCRISVVLEQSVLDALTLREQGKSAREIKRILEQEKYNERVYLTVDTLKYLKKGGRVTPTAAAIGSVLNIKTILTFKGDKIDAFAKARGWKAAKRSMIEAIQYDINHEFGSMKDQLRMMVAYTDSKDAADVWVQELHEVFPEYQIEARPLSLSVACHIGPGCLAVTICKAIS